MAVGRLCPLVVVLAAVGGCCAGGPSTEQPAIVPGDTIVGPYYFFQYELVGSFAEIVGTQPEPRGCVEGRVSRTSDTMVWLDLGSGNDHSCPLEYAVEIPQEEPWTHEVGDWVCYGQGLGRDVGEVVEVLDGEVVVVYRTVWVPPQEARRTTVAADNAVPLHPEVVVIFKRKRVGEQLQERAEEAGTPPRPEGWSPAPGEVVLTRGDVRRWHLARVVSIDEQAAIARVEAGDEQSVPLSGIYPWAPSPDEIEVDDYVLILPPRVGEEPPPVPSLWPAFGQVLSRTENDLHVRDEEGIETTMPPSCCVSLGSAP